MAKRIFDILLSAVGLAIFLWLIIVLFVISSFNTGQNGFFLQQRVGQYGKLFTIVKIRSMKDSLTAKYVTGFGRFIRKYKLDELPQLYNILIGDMSFVGPRPDIPGYYDRLTGKDRDVLQLKPGITGAASLKYRNEEALLEKSADPLRYNDEVIFPDKVKINLQYLQHRSLWLDIKLIWYTVLRIGPGSILK